jgi:hypothetical protein
MKSKPPTTRRKFVTVWDEIGYLYDKLLYWLYQRADPTKARPFVERLERLLPKAAPHHQAILGEECWSLVFEAKGDLPKAIEYRENEIRLMRHLHTISRNTPGEKYALKDRGYDALSDRLDLLAVLYHESGDLHKAIDTLRESKELCAKHGVEFDGEDMLEEYLDEKREGATASGWREKAGRKRA